MTTTSYLISGAGASAASNTTRGMTIALWVAQLATAGILGMGAFAKFFNFTPEGSMALADWSRRRPRC